MCKYFNHQRKRKEEVLLSINFYFSSILICTSTSIAVIEGIIKKSPCNLSGSNVYAGDWFGELAGLFISALKFFNTKPKQLDRSNPSKIPIHNQHYPNKVIIKMYLYKTLMDNQW